MMLVNILLDVSPPPDFWRDPIWQSWGVIVTFVLSMVAIITSVIIFRKQRNQKEITYQVISDTPIVSINEAVQDKVEIRFDGNPVKDMSLIVLKLWNSGNIVTFVE